MQVEKEAAVLMAAPHQHVARVIGVDVNVPGEVRLFTECVLLGVPPSPAPLSPRCVVVHFALGAAGR